ncbi:MAG TPA: hypothetical protein VD840_15460, partial [Sinorhizobium sp.]|nr:hypothetical protein [Sinorhizobium sp.]
MGQDAAGFFRIPSKEEFREALKIDVSGLKESGDEAAQKVADGGRAAGQEIEKSAAFFKVAGYDVGAAIMAAADKLSASAAKFNNAQAAAANASVNGRAPAVNADTGRTMPPSAGRPAGGR